MEPIERFGCVPYTHIQSNLIHDPALASFLALPCSHSRQMTMILPRIDQAGLGHWE
ncbi:hypothetical protein AtDm6_3123 [Acetobacter tropicalis]|uniref:Uncharacterized protein n=1 Tax=Acetobacter tropicalis TaxID=104102 RepID=A0A095AWI1_9PROT|nr:hypothetical protein AtDm6_3123 [Acetobacter tropicalis]